MPSMPTVRLLPVKSSQPAVITIERAAAKAIAAPIFAAGPINAVR